MHRMNIDFLPKTHRNERGDMVPTYMDHEKQCMQFWDEIDLHTQMLEKNANCEKFIFMDGPPFVSGDLHPGHIAVSSAKSILFNYKTMKGYFCQVKMGYDCHGLPAINKTMSDNNLTHEQVKEIGLERFNALCDEMITKYSSSWTPLFKRIGRLTDFNDTYMTRDKNFMESVFWIFKQLWDKNLVYKGNKVMAYSYANQTPLSNFEASQNYKNKDSKSVYVTFEVLGQENTYFVIWTTTPWTLPSNIAICVNDKIEYQKIKVNDKYYIIGKNCIKNVFDKKVKYDVIQIYMGNELVGMKYKSIYSYFDHPNNQIVLSDSYVTEGDIGSAIVHMAPAFGDDDYRVCEQNGLVNNTNIHNYCQIDENGCFTDFINEYSGRLVFETEDDIIMHLKKNGFLIKKQMYTHNYPYCWRSETPLIYRTTPSYYVNVTALKERMIELNQTVNWFPKSVGEGRFYQWLSSIKDWAISRSTSYATPIPIWRSDDGDEICIGSIEELQHYTDKKIDNLHPEFVNDIVIERNCKKYHRIMDTFDCWFESGAVPMAQVHYPFSPDSHYLNDQEYLSDFICEGMDQTRGWFYTLLVLSTAIFDKAPYRNVLCTGFILDKNGNKFSKKMGNFVDPRKTIEEYGADIIRMYFMKSPVMNADSLMFNEDKIVELKSQLVPYINGVSYYLEHSKNFMKKNNIDSFHSIYEKVSDHPFDKWIMVKCNNMVFQVNQYMETYKFSHAIIAMLDFVDVLANQYIKFNRNRFKNVSDFDDCGNALSTLGHVLLAFCKIMAPITPFLSEHIYQHIRFCSKEFDSIDSVLLTSYPIVDQVDNESIKMLNDLMRICNLCRTIRYKTPKHNQAIVPFKNIVICHNDEKYLSTLKNNIYLIATEINCLNIEFNSMKDNITFGLKINNGLIGFEYRKDAKKVIDYLNSLTIEDMKKIHEKSFIPSINGIIIGEKFYEIIEIPVIDPNKTNVINHLDVDLLLCVDYTYDEKVHTIVQAKKLHSKIQSIRKTLGLHPWNPIHVFLKFDNFNETIKKNIEMSLKVQISIVTEIEDNKTNLQHIESYSIEDIENSKNEGIVCVKCLDKFVN